MTFRGDVDGVQDLCHVCRLWREIWEHIVKTDVFALITRLLLHFSVPCSAFRLRGLRGSVGVWRTQKSYEISSARLPLIQKADLS